MEPLKEDDTEKSEEKKFYSNATTYLLSFFTIFFHFLAHCDSVVVGEYIMRARRLVVVEVQYTVVC